MKKEFNLGWGESVAVRQAFLEIAGCDAVVVFGLKTLAALGYPKHEGDPALVDLTRKIIKRQIGRDYKHILISNGATGGVTIALRTFQMKGAYQCWINDPPYFRLFPDMVKAAGLTLYHNSESVTKKSEAVHLIDSPANPLGIFSTMRHSANKDPIVWDATYFNKVYCPGKHPQPDHDVLVGSYGKLTGLNGLRVGWIATNDDLLYDRLRTVVTAEYCGISVASTKIILDSAGKFTDRDWRLFEYKSSLLLDYNREEWSKLEKYFGNQPVTPVGMFYYAPLDKHCKKLLNKSNIIWSPGSSLGTTDDFGRFNMGQDPKLISQAVKEILKNDKI